RMSGLDLELFEFDRGSAQFDLSLTIDTERDGHVRLSYSSELFEEATVRGVLDHYIELIAALTERPDERVALHPMLTPEEAHAILQDWNRTGTQYAATLTHDLISQQARRTPASIAVSMDRESLSYAALERRANQLAHYLLSGRVAPGATVGICL